MCIRLNKTGNNSHTLVYEMGWKYIFPIPPPSAIVGLLAP